MKLYTEEQVRQMLSIYMANVLLDVDGKMPTVDEILNYRTPIELPSDEEIEGQSRNHCNIKQDLIIDYEERYYKDFQKYDAFIDGAKWMKEQILNQTYNN